MTSADLTAVELLAAYRSGELSPVEATQDALARIDTYDGVVNAFCLVQAEDALAAARRLAPDSRVLCASPAYLAEYGEPTSPEDLKQHKCITLTGLDTWSFHTSSGLVSFKPDSPVRIDNGEAVRDACAQGLGLTINSTWSAYELLAGGQLVKVLEDYPLVSNTAIWAVYPSSRLLPPKVSVFIEYLIQQFGPKPYWDYSKDK